MHSVIGMLEYGRLQQRAELGPECVGRDSKLARVDDFGQEPGAES